MVNRERMEVDVLFVGGGPASLAGALHLMDKIKFHNQQIEQGIVEGEKLEDLAVVLIEKGAEIGAHSLSGAVLDPVTLEELVPDFRDRGAPIEHTVEKESLYYFSAASKFRSPFIPKQLKNRGGYVISLSRFTRWLEGLVVERGCDVFPGFPGVETLFDGDRVIGVRTGDKGVDKDGNRKENFEPGIDLIAKVTIFGEGPRGNLTKQIIPRLGLSSGKNPMTYLTGVKELWELGSGNSGPAEVIHTLGYPFKSDTYGGGFVYPMAGNRIALGVLAGVNSPDPFSDTHEQFQTFKNHPLIRALIHDGEMVEYGAKTVSVGGFYSIPTLAFDGGMLIGDCGGIFNSQRTKGIHLAMKSGMLAAEAALSALIGSDYTKKTLGCYESALREGYVGRELWAARNFHQAFDRGRITGMLNAAYGFIAGGRGLSHWMGSEADHEQMKTVSDYSGKEEAKVPPRFDGNLTFDKATSVYHSGTIHEEDQPCHLHVEDLSVCHGRCRKEFQNPCVKFCPAGVYEMALDEESGEERLRINFANCVHCKTCDIRDPYGIINWVPPEGGGGPKYTLM
jgi:electron-transferring-flavoprotein dehydrogenase